MHLDTDWHDGDMAADNKLHLLTHTTVPGNANFLHFGYLSADLKAQHDNLVHG